MQLNNLEVKANTRVERPNYTVHIVNKPTDKSHFHTEGAIDVSTIVGFGLSLNLPSQGGISRCNFQSYMTRLTRLGWSRYQSI